VIHDAAKGEFAMAQLGWNGEWYVNYGCIEATPSDKTRSWSEALKYNFVGAGGGPWYSVPFRRLQAGDRIWVKVPGVGFVGVARVSAEPVPLRQFRIQTSEGERRAADVLNLGHYVRHHINDLAMCDYFARVKWLDAVSALGAIGEPGLAGYRNTACKPVTPAWDRTVARLKRFFPKYDG
jgi:hypothetical protein